eukprot:861095-Rhodomonas_salina.3
MLPLHDACCVPTSSCCCVALHACLTLHACVLTLRRACWLFMVCCCLFAQEQARTATRQDAGQSPCFPALRNQKPETQISLHVMRRNKILVFDFALSAMSSTEAMLLWICYAVSGTGLGHSLCRLQYSRVLSLYCATNFLWVVGTIDTSDATTRATLQAFRDAAKGTELPI